MIHTKHTLDLSSTLHTKLQTHLVCTSTMLAGVALSSGSTTHESNSQEEERQGHHHKLNTARKLSVLPTRRRMFINV